MFIAPDEPMPQIQAVIEGFVDGILILTKDGGWVQANATASRLCLQFGARSQMVPQPIWRICAALIDSRTAFAQQKLILEAEIITPAQVKLRVRVQWLPGIDRAPYLLVVLEDCSQSAQHLTAWSLQKYGLTARQAEVWALRQLGYSYQEIGARLYITRNTVKKHLKDSYAKIREVREWEEDASDRGSVLLSS